MNFNVKFYTFFEQLLYRVELLGPPISIVAWLSVFFATITIGHIVRKSLSRKILIPALIVGGVSLVAHLLDYVVTLHVSPTLAEEVNPIWRIVIDNYGLRIAKVYGLTGKILVSILSFEFFAYYYIQRKRLFPKNAANFFSFWREFGVSNGKESVMHLSNSINFFSFAFALLGPFYFYIALLNSMIDNVVYYRLPPMLLMLLIYLIAIVAAYFITTYQAFRSQEDSIA